MSYVTCPRCSAETHDTDGHSVRFLLTTEQDDWTGDEPLLWFCWVCSAIAVEAPETKELTWYTPMQSTKENPR